MKNKKLILPIAGLAIMSLAVPVFAADLNKDVTSGTTVVSYGVNSGYTVSIPSAVNFTSSTLTQSGQVTASNVIIENGKTLKVKMTSANYTEEDGYTLNYGDGEVSKIKYTIKNGDVDFVNGASVLEVAAGTTAGGTSTLNFATTTEDIEAATKSGEHKDTLTFNVSVE